MRNLEELNQRLQFITQFPEFNKLVTTIKQSRPKYYTFSDMMCIDLNKLISYLKELQNYEEVLKLLQKKSKLFNREMDTSELDSVNIHTMHAETKLVEQLIAIRKKNIKIEQLDINKEELSSIKFSVKNIEKLTQNRIILITNTPPDSTSSESPDFLSEESSRTSSPETDIAAKRPRVISSTGAILTTGTSRPERTYSLPAMLRNPLATDSVPNNQPNVNEVESDSKEKELTEKKEEITEESFILSTENKFNQLLKSKDNENLKQADVSSDGYVAIVLRLVKKRFNQLNQINFKDKEKIFDRVIGLALENLFYSNIKHDKNTQVIEDLDSEIELVLRSIDSNNSKIIPCLDVETKEDEFLIAVDKVLNYSINLQNELKQVSVNLANNPHGLLNGSVRLQSDLNSVSKNASESITKKVFY